MTSDSREPIAALNIVDVKLCNIATLFPGQFAAGPIAITGSPLGIKASAFSMVLLLKEREGAGGGETPSNQRVF